MEKNMFYSIILAAAMAVSCTETNPSYVSPEPETHPEPADRSTFALGADISWATQLEAEGYSFRNAEGEQRECTVLMKEIGMNAIRLRVWVNPAAGWSNKGDVLVKALRAHNLGMRLMIDFHYSDTWADPGHQAVPAAWAGYDIEELKAAMTDHTVEVLSMLKERGIDVEWVQVGNETRTGMMWPLGSASDYPQNYAALTAAGYDAVKSVYPDASVIVHLDGGDDIGRYTWLFGILDNYAAKYDMIGMSLYPWYNTAGEGEAEVYDWRPAVQSCVSNITALAERYGCPVMICETGMPYSEPDETYAMLAYLIGNAKATGYCSGVFYWEPEAPAGYNDGYLLGAFDDGMPTHALDAFTEASVR